MHYTMSQAARLLRVDPRTLRRWLEYEMGCGKVDPDDQRRRLLTHEQVTRIGRQHNRPDIEAKISTDGHTFTVDELPEAAVLATKIEVLERMIEDTHDEQRRLNMKIGQLSKQLDKMKVRTRSTAKRLLQIEAQNGKSAPNEHSLA